MEQEEFAVPVVSVVGRGKSGRTTLLEGIISTLTERGWRVATAKNHAHDTDIDVPGKDTWRHERAGAVVTMISAPNRYGIIRKVDRPRTLQEMVAEAGDVDIVLTEGFSATSPVLIEVVRAERSTEPRYAPEELFARVTDVEELKDGSLPTFGLDEAREVADLIEERFIARERPR